MAAESKRFITPMIMLCAAGLLAHSPQAEAKVKPGLVRWHASFEEAKASSKKSGKPVLLFHMMGRLDERFC